MDRTVLLPMLLSLTIVASIYIEVVSRGRILSLLTEGHEEPIEVNWRIAIISEDRLFISQVKQALRAREFKEFSVRKAGETVGFDLIIIGWDALPVIAYNKSLVELLLTSGKLLATAEPGLDSIQILLSSIQLPIKLGEKPKEDTILAFIPLIERRGYLTPGSPFNENLVLVETWHLKDGKIGISYITTSFKEKNKVKKAIMLVIRRALSKARELQAFPRNQFVNDHSGMSILRSESDILLSNIPPGSWSYIGSWTSIRYPIISNAFKDEVGETYITIRVFYNTVFKDISYPYTKEWLIFVQEHYAKTYSGYSLPTRVSTSLPWSIEPNSLIIDARTDIYSDQRIENFYPTGTGGGGYTISITASMGSTSVTFKATTKEEITYDADSLSAFSSYYGGRVGKNAIWRWGLTVYDDSGTRYYSMASYATIEGENPIYFAIEFKANAFWYEGGGTIVDTASSGLFTIYFKATTNSLEEVGREWRG